MENNTPLANPSGPNVPSAAAPPTPAPPAIPQATPTPGAVSQPPAPPARRSRTPRGPVPQATPGSTSGAPALLELSAGLPMYTVPRRGVNTFVPDAQMLFHVLGICDQMMLSTDRFTRSSPAWIPIVSQLYISVLWMVAILRVFVASGYGALYSSLINDLIGHLRIDECMIPGPLVPFFQSLGAVCGPYEWIGDIVAAFPDFLTLWDAENFCPTADLARTCPVPAIMLDQLHYFATWTIPAEQILYTNFQWYRNIFSLGLGAGNANNRIGPQLCGSLYSPRAQVDSARAFWNAALSSGITRTNAAEANGAFYTYAQLLGFISQNGTLQLDWFQQVAVVMQKYTQYFNGSTPLKSISTIGIGAVAVIGAPTPDPATRDWFYPAATGIEPFLCSRFAPRREIPNTLGMIFSHADHELEEQAEQYAILTHTNIRWSPSVVAQNAWTAVNDGASRNGDYWIMMNYRFSTRISLKTQFAQVIASRYHQQAANRVD
ncbi:coat protein [Beet cryptic virus 1]|uniref:Coat protein n=1 Tax=Beet cryptic virus 1 TaxID=509923 RepID=B2CGP4_9VIRU|nr:coat protein [Beet cryptic virus 1]ACA81390.1 coat protein [Beet cryptic virus 1]